MLRKQVVCGCNASRIQIDRAYSKVDRSRHATCTILADISIPKLFQGVPPCINSTNMNQQKALEATSELTIFLMQLQGEEGPETNLLQLDTCWWGAMYSKCASGKVIKADKPGGRMHWLLRSGSSPSGLAAETSKILSSNLMQNSQVSTLETDGQYTEKHSATKTPKWAANAHIVVSWPNGSLKRVFVEIWLSWPYLYSTSIHKFYK